VRNLLRIVLCPVLLLSLQQAPLLHVHENDHPTEHVTTEHRHGLGAHTHLSPHSKTSHSEERSEIETADDNESVVAISFFHSGNPKTSIQPVIVRACPLIDTPKPIVVRVAGERPRIHDPPLHSSLIPRAPPA
jgi:hypothetical protein